MTDKDMAVALGEEINRLRSRVDALEGTFMEYRVQNPVTGRNQEPQWRQTAELVAQEDSHKQMIAVRSQRLQDALDGAEDGSSLIQALWRNYCHTQSMR